MFKRTCDNPGPKQDTEIITDAWFEKEDTVHLTIDESSQMYKRFMFFYRRDEVSKHRYSARKKILVFLVRWVSFYLAGAALI